MMCSDEGVAVLVLRWEEKERGFEVESHCEWI